MKSLFKWLLIAVLVVVLLPIVVGVIVSVFIDPNDFKPQIIEAVEKQTRGSLAIDGELNWSLFPNIGVNLNKVTFALPEDKDAPFAALESVKLGVKFLPLLKAAVEADGLTVQGLKVHLYTDKNGVNNWEQIFPESKTQPKPAEEESSTLQAAPLSVDIAKIAIIDSAVSMINDLEGTQYLLENFNFESTNISVDGGTFPLSMSFKVQLSEPLLNVQTHIKTDLSADVAKQTYAFNKLTGDFLLTGETFDDKTVSIDLNSSGTYNGANSTANLKSLSLDIANQLKIQLEAQAFMAGKMKLAGSINVDSFNANKLMEALGMEPMAFNNSDALSDISFKGTLSGPANSLIMDPVTLKLDSTTLNGRMGIKNMDTSEYVFSMKGDKINIDDYATAATEEDITATTTTASTDINAALLPLAALRDLLFNAQFGFQEIIAGGLTITQLDMKASGKNGLLKLNSMDAKLYQGAMTMNATVDARKNDPSIVLNAKLNGVDMKSLLKDFSDLDTISGTARFDAHFTTSGNTSASFQNKLNGPLSFGIDNAVFSGLNVDKLACQAISAARQKTLTKTDWPTATTFKKIGGAFNFVNGVGTNNDLTASLDNMMIKGAGNINLPAETVDYQVALRINGDLTAPAEDGTESACAINERYKTIDWPIRCKGKLSDDPGDLCGIDTSALGKVAKQLVKAQAHEKLDAEKNRLKNKLTEKWGLNKKQNKKQKQKPKTDGTDTDNSEPDAKEDAKDALKRKLLDFL